MKKIAKHHPAPTKGQIMALGLSSSMDIATQLSRYLRHKHGGGPAGDAAVAAAAEVIGGSESCEDLHEGLHRIVGLKYTEEDRRSSRIRHNLDVASQHLDKALEAMRMLREVV